MTMVTSWLSREFVWGTLWLEFKVYSFKYKHISEIQFLSSSHFSQNIQLQAFVCCLVGGRLRMPPDVSLTKVFQQIVDRRSSWQREYCIAVFRKLLTAHKFKGCLKILEVKVLCLVLKHDCKFPLVPSIHFNLRSKKIR